MGAMPIPTLPVGMLDMSLPDTSQSASAPPPPPPVLVMVMVLSLSSVMLIPDPATRLRLPARPLSEVTAALLSTPRAVRA